jgi:ATP-binding protein involved in chromosome partitioning
MKSYHDIVGDGGSNIVEQVGAQRARIAENLAGVRHLLAVGSGKGGVGKSTLALQLARALAAAGSRCAILDADLNGPTQARMAGLGQVPFVPGARGIALPRTAEGLGVVSFGAVVPESRSVELSEDERDSHVWRATREFTTLGQLLGAVEWGALDYLLVDLPPGAERTRHYAEFFGPQVAFLLVTLPSGVSRGVVSRSAAALGRMPNRLLGYVENMAGYYCAGCDELRPLFPSGDEAALGIPCLGRVPFDPELAAAGDLGAALDSDRPAAAALRAVARRLGTALARDARDAPEDGAKQNEGRPRAARPTQATDKEMS